MLYRRRTHNMGFFLEAQKDSVILAYGKQTAALEMYPADALWVAASKHVTRRKLSGLRQYANRA